ETGAFGRLHGRDETRLMRRSLPLLGLVAVALLTGCGGHKQARVNVPPPPPVTSPPPAPVPPSESTEADESIRVPPNAKPILTETGMASWYGAPYHNRRGSNGEVYDMHAMTAAHRTLPLGSIVR